MAIIHTFIDKYGIDHDVAYTRVSVNYIQKEKIVTVPFAPATPAVLDYERDASGNAIVDVQGDTPQTTTYKTVEVSPAVPETPEESRMAFVVYPIVRTYVSSDKVDFEPVSVSQPAPFEYQNGNVLEEAEAYLKTLPEFEGAVDA